MKRSLAFLSALLLFCALGAWGARADEPLYHSYAYTPDGRPFYMQTPYEPASVVGQYLYTPEGAQISGLNAPSDLCLKDDGTLFIADRGNNRVVQITVDGVLLREYGVGVLKGPEGVFVDGEGTVYAADTGNAAIVIFNADGSVRDTLTAPSARKTCP